MCLRTNSRIGMSAFFVLCLSFASTCVLPTILAEPVAASTQTLALPGGQIYIVFKGRELDLPRQEVIDWVSRASGAIVSYFGKLPMRHITIEITGTSGKGVGFATATSDDDNDGLIEVPIGQHTTAGQLKRDWVLTHEMVHLNFPLVTDSRTWAAEGMATYVEPLARLQNGELSSEKVFGDLVSDLPQGLPESGDRGLDYTGTWGRTYWGGALFYLIADVEIRQRTNNRKGLQDAFKAIAASGGHIGSNWSIEKSFAVGDKATGVPVLQDLYRTMRARPVSVNLPRLWRALGVERNGDKITFNDKAPLSSIRAAIIRGG